MNPNNLLIFLMKKLDLIVDILTQKSLFFQMSVYYNHWRALNKSTNFYHSQMLLNTPTRRRASIIIISASFVAPQLDLNMLKKVIKSNG